MISDTIAAIATAPGQAGIAVVRVSGSDAFVVAERLTGRTVANPGCRTLEVRAPGSRIVLDTCVVLAFKSPRSYTGEDVVEFQCHGGSVTPRRILEATFAAGARLAHRGEFTQRAFLNGKLDYAQAEAVLDLIQAKTERAADAALAGIAGERSREIRSLYDDALALSSKLEHSLDVDEGELTDDFKSAVTGELESMKSRLSSALARVRRNRILKDGALVVLAGSPNAGKSSLLNALIGESRAIVSEVPGTTRDAIESWTDLGGFPVRLVDTAGLRKTSDAIEAEGVARSEALVRAADIVIAFDGAEFPSAAKVIRIRAKCDLASNGGSSPDDCAAQRLAVSSKTGEGLDALRAELVRTLSGLSPRDEPRDAETILAAIRFLDGVPSDDPVLAANGVRSAAQVLGESLGEQYSSDLLDRLFSRFCVGK